MTLSSITATKFSPELAVYKIELRYSLKGQCTGIVYASEAV